MKTDSLFRRHAGRTSVIALAGIQWLLLTVALGAMVIYTDRSLEGLLGLHIEGGYAFFGAVLIGFLLGATIEHTKALITLSFLSCVGAAAMYVALLLLPVWTDTIIGTTGLENFATTRALLYFGLAVIPVSMGALGGRLIGPMIPGGDRLADPRDKDQHLWWLDRAAHEGRASDSLQPSEKGSEGSETT